MIDGQDFAKSQSPSSGALIPTRFETVPDYERMAKMSQSPSSGALIPTLFTCLGLWVMLLLSQSPSSGALIPTPHKYDANRHRICWSQSPSSGALIPTNGDLTDLYCATTVTIAFQRRTHSNPGDHNPLRRRVLRPGFEDRAEKRRMTAPADWPCAATPCGADI